MSYDRIHLKCGPFQQTFAEVEFQTKGLDCRGRLFEINDAGQLRLREKLEYNPDFAPATNDWRDAANLMYIAQCDEEVNLSGTVELYTFHPRYGWMECTAEVRDGQVQEIVFPL
jgi:hypothetical protein